MSHQPLPILDVTSVKELFREHLLEEYNERILFSGPFGSGKTTFLKTFFENNSEYIVLKFYPVNYAVAANQDVFEMIKYDLLYELLSKYPDDVELKQEEYSFLLIAQMFLLHQMRIDAPIKMLLKAGEALSGSGSIASDTVEEVSKSISEFSEFKGKMNENEFAMLKKYVASFRNSKGNVHESDDISKLIRDLIDRIKLKRDNEGRTKTILLIDDLDRLDPEHVFRLFNVFSAHYDDAVNSNKFGFDKVIFVCDVNNIQQMFNHRYGINVEFNGYIDKFYSSEVFRFDVRAYIKESLRELMLSKNEIKRFFPKEGTLDDSFVKSYGLDGHGSFFEVIRRVMDQMVDLNIIHFRNFQRFKYYAIPNRTFSYESRDIHFAFYPALVLFSNLERFFTRPVDMEHALIKLYKDYSSDYSLALPNYYPHNGADKALIEFSLAFLVDPKQIFAGDYQRNETLVLKCRNELDQPIEFQYSFTESRTFSYTSVNFRRCALDEYADEETKAWSARRPNAFWFLYCAYQNVKRNNYLI